MKKKVKSSPEPSSNKALSATKHKQNKQITSRPNPTLTRGVQNKHTKKKKGVPLKKNYSEMNVNDFMSGAILDSDEESDSEGCESDDSSQPNVELKTTINGSRPMPRPSSRPITNGVNGGSLIEFEADEGEEELGEDDSYSDDDEDENDEETTCNGSSFIDDEAAEDYTFDPHDHNTDDDESDEHNDTLDSVVVGSNAESGEQNDTLDSDAANSDDDAADEGLSASDHKKSLQRLRDTDPEFYKYLEENDKKLLQFNVSDSDSDEEDEDKCHKPAEDELEVGSDESDYEADVKEEGVERQDGLITLKMIRDWEERIQVDKSVATIADVVQAFHAALNRVTGSDEPNKFKVDGSAVFNGVIQLCVLQLQPALNKFLRLPPGAAGKHIQLHKCKKWNKVKSLLKSYLFGLLKLMSGVSSPHIVSVLLKHLHQMSQYVSSFPNVIQKAMKRLISIWGSGDDTTRVIAFLCILRLTTNQTSLLETVLKNMYLTFVSNSKFTSPNTLPGINFMRRSLVEIYSLDESASYQHVFLYIRQLAIHLRNAITLQKKEAVQAVLNWQFVHSLHLWAGLLSVNKPTLQPLLYPLVQVIIGTIKLIPTTQYFPLRFHCTQMLIDLSQSTSTFIPILPFLLEVLNTYDFNKRHKKVSMKPMDLTCVLRVTKLEQTENCFKDAVVELIFQQMLQYLANESHTIGFPDIVGPTSLQMRKFLKACKVSNYCKKLRSLVEKMEQNSVFLEKERKGITLLLSDSKAVDAWETNVKLKGTPLATFYAGFQSVNKRVMAKRATNNDKLGDFKIPVIHKRAKKAAAEGENGPAVLFPSDSESDNGFGTDEPEPEIEEPKRKKRKTKKSKKVNVPQASIVPHVEEGESQEDIVQDLNLDDF